MIEPSTVESTAIGFTLAIGVGVVGTMIGLWVWANAVARKHPNSLYQRARWLPRIGTVLLTAGLLVTVVGLVRSFGEVANSDAASKATLLARGISRAMNYGAAPVMLAVLCFVVSGISSLAGTLRHAKATEAR